MILSGEDIASVLNMRSVLTAVEQAYAYKCEGKAQLFPLICHTFDGGDAELDIKSGRVDGAGVFGVKLVSYFPGNPKLGIPALMGTILIFERATGVLKAVMDGTRITNMRTGAAGAVGVKYLARSESENLLMVGAGTQAINLVMATLEVMEGIRSVTVCDPLSFEQARRFADSIRGRMESEYTSLYLGTPHYEVMMERLDIEYAPTADLKSACESADIILTATPSRAPLVMADWIKPGTHLSCIGADMEGKQEIDERLIARARVFVDDIDQAVSVGECEKAYKQGILRREQITEIGQVILGVAPGRCGRDDVTVFDSTGIAIQDLMTAQVASLLVLDKGRQTMVSI